MIIERTLEDKIIKIVDGKEKVQIQLTGNELRQAYKEYEHQCDVEDIDNELEKEDFFNDYGVSSILLRPYIEELAYEKRRQIDDYDMHWSDAVCEAINNKIHNL